MLTCEHCNDTRIIQREETIMDQYIGYGCYYGGFLKSTQVLVHQRIGGIDACPVCAVIAESEYQNRAESDG